MTAKRTRRGRPKKVVGSAPSENVPDVMLDQALETVREVEGPPDPAIRFFHYAYWDETTKLTTKHIVNRFLSCKRLGLSDTKACLLAGFSAAYMQNWLKQGREEIERRDNGREADPHAERYILFLAAYMDASVQPLTQALKTISESVNAGNTDTAKWVAERHDPEAFAPIRRNEIIQKGTVEHTHILALPPDRIHLLTGDKVEQAPLLPTGDILEAEIIDDLEV